MVSAFRRSIKSKAVKNISIQLDLLFFQNQSYIETLFKGGVRVGEISDWNEVITHIRKIGPLMKEMKKT